MAKRLLVNGASGRMGRSLIANLAAFPSLQLSAAIDRADCGLLGRDSGELAGLKANGVAVTTDLAAALQRTDIILDFSNATGSPAVLEACVAARVACFMGTTGQGPEFAARLTLAAETIPVLLAANTSLGVNLLLELTKQAARSLPGFDIEISEAHHRHKQDAPSGTALALGRAAASGRGADFAAVRGRTRDGIAPRQAAEIGFAVVRAGDIVGDHEILFAGEGERVVLKHQVTDRTIFAKGALAGAAWLAERPPGQYHMLDVLGLRTTT